VEESCFAMSVVCVFAGLYRALYTYVYILIIHIYIYMFIYSLEYIYIHILYIHIHFGIYIYISILLFVCYIHIYVYICGLIFLEVLVSKACTDFCFCLARCGRPRLNMQTTFVRQCSQLLQVARTTVLKTTSEPNNLFKAPCNSCVSLQ